MIGGGERKLTNQQCYSPMADLWTLSTTTPNPTTLALTVIEPYYNLIPLLFCFFAAYGVVDNMI